MPHESGLIVTLAVGLVAAFIGGFVATKLRLPAIVGYLLAGIAVGPYTPGFVGNPTVAQELAEIGVILLMFGVGIHFSLRDLLAVRKVAIPGALAQIALATLLGGLLAISWGWSLRAGLVLGLALSVASTVVLLRALMDEEALNTLHGRVAIGWLIVEDLFTVLVLVLLPALAVMLGSETKAGLAAAAGGGNVLLTLAIALGKTALFVLLMLFIGARAVPWILVQVARSGSREMFTLAVLAAALGIAVGSATLFGVSLALGAFLAGMVIGESDMSHQAAADALPMRDAFAVLFFVSVGMLFDPSFLIKEPGRLFAVLGIVLLGKSIAALLIVFLLGYPLRTGLTVSAGLAQIGEFSFIVAGLGRDLGLLPDEGYQLVLGASLFSITLNPLMFRCIDPVEAWLRRRPALLSRIERRAAGVEAETSEASGAFRDHAVVCGYGRVGSVIGELLRHRGIPYVVVEQDRGVVEELRRRGVPAFYGDAGNTEILAHTHLPRARVLVVAVADLRAARQIVEYARRVNPSLEIIARTHSEQEWEYLRERVSEAVLGEREAALEMAGMTLSRFEVGQEEIRAILSQLRRRVDLEPFGDSAARAEEDRR